MDCVDLSLKKLYKSCRNWCKQIKPTYAPEMVIYISRGGYIIGRAMQAGFDVPLVGIGAVRKGNRVKEYLFPVLAVLPRKICNTMRRMEIRSRVHQRQADRQIRFHKELANIANPCAIKKILLVDDSIDTGQSMQQVREHVARQFPSAEIRIFVLNEMTSQQPVIRADYAIYRDTAMRTPMSKDSREYYKFLKLYKNRNKHLLYKKGKYD